MSKSVPTVERMVRVRLELAVDDGLVQPAVDQWDDPDPRARTAEELAGVAGVPALCLRDAAAAGGAEREPTEPVTVDPPADGGGS